MNVSQVICTEHTVDVSVVLVSYIFSKQKQNTLNSISTSVYSTCTYYNRKSIPSPFCNIQYNRWSDIGREN